MNSDPESTLQLSCSPMAYAALQVKLLSAVVRQSVAYTGGWQHNTRHGVPHSKHKDTSSQSSHE
jgi:hypothetical protein